MARQIRWIFVCFLPLFLFSQKKGVQCIEGDATLSFLKNEKDLSVLFDYSNLSFDSIPDFQKYLATRPDKGSDVRFIQPYPGMMFSVVDANDAYNKICFGPYDRIKAEPEFYKLFSEFLGKHDIHISRHLDRGKYKLIIEFGNIETNYKNGVSYSQVFTKLKNLKFKFVDIQTNEVKAVFVNYKYMGKFRKWHTKDLARDFGSTFYNKLVKIYRD